MPDVASAQKFAFDRVNRLLAGLSRQVRKTLESRDAEVVHDLRVAVRRFAQPLAVFDTWFTSKQLPAIDRQLKALRSAAGGVRDCDIALELLAKSKVEGVSKLSDALASRRKAAERRLVSSLRRWANQKRAASWRAELAAMEVPQEFQHNSWEDQAKRELPRTAKALFRSSTSNSGLHKLRIRAKKFRYTLELFQQAYGEAGKARIEQLRDVQTLLGDINDLRTARNLLDDLGAGRKVTAALKKKQRKKIREFRSLWEVQFSRSAIKEWMEFLRGTPKKPVAGSKPSTPAVQLAALSA